MVDTNKTILQCITIEEMVKEIEITPFQLYEYIVQCIHDGKSEKDYGICRLPDSTIYFESPSKITHIRHKLLEKVPINLTMKEGLKIVAPYVRKAKLKRLMK